MKIKIYLVLLGCLLLQTACAINPVIKDKDYKVAETLYGESNPGDALRKFPTREAGGFITSVEKSWLEFWQERWNPERLRQLRQSFDSRNYISLTRELGYFLWQEAEDGYVPSEHEWVILNLVRAQHFIQSEKPEQAKVELRQAQRLLEQHWDDPALRIWLGSLWASVGEWQEAQVDFRNASLPMGAEKAPKKIYLHFTGVGPELDWMPSRYEPEILQGSSGDLNEVSYKFSTVAWFERHLQRNNSLRDLLVKTNYQSQYLGSEMLTSVESGINRTAEWTVKGGGVLLGGAILVGGIYAMAHQAPVWLSGSGGEAVGYGIIGGAALVAYGAWELGERIGKTGLRKVQKDYEAKMDSLKIYRCVRFLPTWMGITTEPLYKSAMDKVIPLKSVGETEVFLVNHF